ncbi:MAG: hypothetical protein QOF24_179 [Verrucomicrobiota bacterium]|jgi:SAM-dependent methyltransferase
MRLTSISTPDHLQRNSFEILQAGIENGGGALLELLARRIGRADLSGIDLLDVGCGVRFTQTLINRSILFGSYTGLDVSLPVIEWLREHVEKKDERFRYAHWNVRNALYNNEPSAVPIRSCSTFPVEGTFDIITGFSLFTHLDPEDAEQMLRLMRKAVRSTGYLFFSAFCHDETLQTFKDADPDHPLSEAHYGRKYLESMLPAAGWQLVSHEGQSFFIADSFLCRPTESCACSDC